MKSLILFTLVWLSAGIAPLAARPYTWGNLAGLPGAAGNAAGQGTAARLNSPFQIAVDLQGNTYVADYNNHVIRKVTPAGVVTDWAGGAGVPGATDANGTAARFNFPVGVACAEDGTLYVADTGNHTIRKISPSRQVTTVAGSPLSAGINNGTGGAARFRFPNGVCVGSGGVVYVADTYNHTIRRINAGEVTTIAGLAGSPGSNDKLASADNPARFDTPTGVFFVPDSNRLIIADYENHLVREHDLQTGFTSTLAGAAGQAGGTDGTGTSARFNHPLGVTGNTDSIFVTDYDGHTVRRIDASRAVTTLGGSAGVPGTTAGTGTAARFNRPAGIALTFDGVLVVSDAASHRLSLGVMRPEPGEYYWSGLAGLPNKEMHADGVRGHARLTRPFGMTTDAAGNLYVADPGDHVVRKITPDGIATTIAGYPYSPGSEESIGVENRARLRGPTDVAMDAAGNLYIADSGNYTIRRLSSSGVMSTLAGVPGLLGHVDGPGTTARLGGVGGIAIGPDGHLYFAEYDSNIIRKMTPAGEVSTLAGSPGSTGAANGTGTAARFDRPYDVAVNAQGLCYVSDTGNRLIRTVSPAGVVGTLAGGGGASEGPGAQVGFYSPTGLAIDREGVLYVADLYVARRVLPSGYSTWLLGNTGGSFQDARYGPGREAMFADIFGIAISASGDLFLSSILGFVTTGTLNGPSRLQRSGGVVDLTFGAQPYQSYHIQRSTTMLPGGWTTLASPGGNFSGSIRYTDPAPPAGKAFYRLSPF